MLAHNASFITPPELVRLTMEADLWDGTGPRFTPDPMDYTPPPPMMGP